MKGKIAVKTGLIAFWCLIGLQRSVTISAQSQDKSKLVRTEIRVQGCRFAKEFRPYELTSAIGWNINRRFFTNLQGEAAIALFDIDGQKTYQTNYTLGLNGGYTFVRCDGCSLDARVGTGIKIGKSENWKYHYYDVAVIMHVGKGRCRPSFGLGVRRYQSHNDLFKDRTRFYATVGMIFGG